MTRKAIGWVMWTKTGMTRDPYIRVYSGDRVGFYEE